MPQEGEMSPLFLQLVVVHRHSTFNNPKETIQTLKKNMIKNPNWQEATSWLFTKRGRVESRTTGNKSKPEVRMGFELRQLQSTTRPRCLPNMKDKMTCLIAQISGTAPLQRLWVQNLFRPEFSRLSLFLLLTVSTCSNNLMRTSTQEIRPL